MKIRAYIVTVTGVTDPIRDYLTTVEPPMGEGAWATYLRGATRGLVLVRYDEAVFDPAVLAALTGVVALPAAQLDQSYAQVRNPARNAIKNAIESSIGGTVDDTTWETWEDALCEVLRRIGETGRRTLRDDPSQRTRGFLDEFG